MTTDDRHLDTIASWLTLEDPEPDHVDLMLLFGGSLPPGWDQAAAAVHAGRVGTLMLVGGRGHTTDALCRLVGVDDEAVMTEADLMAAHLRHAHGIGQVLLERTSTNCGNNVTLARELASRHGLRPRTVALCAGPHDAAAHGCRLPMGVAGRRAHQPSCARRASHVASRSVDLPRHG